MKSLHDLVPVCLVPICTLFMASAAAGYSGGHSAGGGAGHASAGHLGSAGANTSAAGKLPPMSRASLVSRHGIPGNNTPTAGTFCAYHWKEDACRGYTALHDEALKIQRQDGGTLTPQHRTELQSKLDAVLAEVQSKLDAAQAHSS